MLLILRAGSDVQEADGVRAEGGGNGGEGGGEGQDWGWELLRIAAGGNVDALQVFLQEFTRFTRQFTGFTSTRCKCC
jgi:hypothetical protein